MDEVLHQGEYLTARAMRRASGALPAREWLDGLDKKGEGQFHAACDALESSYRSGRPPAGRAAKVAGSREGLWELRVTPRGGRPPRRRAFYVRENTTIWLASGITKKTNKLRKRDIEQADRITREWRASRRGCT